jgi:transposase InsO family protein
MAVGNRAPSRGTVIHSDHGSQFSSWAFSERVREAGLVPSMGTVGDAFDNAVIESFWPRLQTELLNRKNWKTRIELSTALFEYLEIFHNRNRRHSSLGMLTPIEYEKVNSQSTNAA